MDPNGCFPFTFYFSLTFIKTSGSLEWAICMRLLITQTHDFPPSLRTFTLWQEVKKNPEVDVYEIRRKTNKQTNEYINKHNNVYLAIKHNLDGRRPRSNSVRFVMDELCVSAFPSHCLLISFHNYLIMSLTDAVNKSAENAIIIIKKKKEKKKWKKQQREGWTEADCRWDWNSVKSSVLRFTPHFSFTSFFKFTSTGFLGFFFLPFRSNSDRTRENKQRTHMEHYH